MVPRTAPYRAARNTTFPWGIWKAGTERNADPTDPRVVAAVETGQLVPLDAPKVKRTRKASAPKLGVGRPIAPGDPIGVSVFWVIRRDDGEVMASYTTEEEADEVWGSDMYDRSEYQLVDPNGTVVAGAGTGLKGDE